MSRAYIVISKSPGGETGVCLTADEGTAHTLLTDEHNAEVFHVNMDLLKHNRFLAVEPVFGVTDGEPWNARGKKP